MKGMAFAELVATGLGSGYLPVAPGTWGSLFAVFLAALVHWFFAAWDRTFLWTALLASTLVGTLCATQVVRREGSHDPSKVVIDEIAGQFLTLLWIPVSAFSLVVGFFLFRLFDVIKPFPARRAEGLPEGWGIMADDLIAAVYSGIVLYVLSIFVQS
jgi:phosphatidylglycerophosphatase A